MGDNMRTAIWGFMHVRTPKMIIALKWYRCSRCQRTAPSPWRCVSKKYYEKHLGGGLAGGQAAPHERVTQFTSGIIEVIWAVSYGVRQLVSFEWEHRYHLADIITENVCLNVIYDCYARNLKENPKLKNQTKNLLCHEWQSKRWRHAFLKDFHQTDYGVCKIIMEVVEWTCFMHVRTPKKRQKCVGTCFMHVRV